MVRWAVPTARIAKDLQTLHMPFKIGRTPDVIQPAATIRFDPILGAIAPPGEDFLVCRNKLSHQVAPATLHTQIFQRFGFYRRMADDLEKLLVRPDIVFKRRDIEIAKRERKNVRPAGRQR